MFSLGDDDANHCPVHSIIADAFKEHFMIQIIWTITTGSLILNINSGFTLLPMWGVDFGQMV